jgi:ABC-2 type transport system permease protein
MNESWRFPKAILKRELTSYFSSPIGYVFITLFVFLSAVAAFWQGAFFANNLANLDPLNRFMPYLLVFLIPAITMSLWAEEKRNGTDELLLTLPATDRDIVIGKYLAALSIYSVALLFSLSHVFVLMWLGSPDLGLMFSTYVGYWLMGAALLTLGMLVSLLTSNLTVAFILGAALCAIPVFIHNAGVIVSGGLQRLIEALSFRDQFQDFASGVFSLSSLLYFVTFTLAMLYLNVALLGRRHWQTGKGAPPLGRHYLARGLAMLVIVASLTVLTSRLGGRVDLTAERLHSLSDETVELIGQLDPERPVFIQAFMSRDVPRRYLQTRNNIVNALREFNALGGGAIQTRVIETEKYTPEAREAQERYNIQPRPIPIFEQTPGSPDEIFFGIAFSRGAEEFVIPFFDPGLPAEYEILRSVRVVSNAAKKKVGVLNTKVNMFGGFDFQSRRQSTDWSIVAELRKQYEVVRVPADADYPAGLDVLLAVLPHTISDEELERLTSYVKAGNPALIVLDPLPAFNIELSPQIPPRNPFQQGAPPPAPPTDVQPLLDALGVQWPKDQIAWDKYNPHPQIGKLPEEIIFIGAGNEASKSPFNQDDPVTSGLQEVVLMHSGVLRPSESGATEFIPLLQTGVDSGQVMWMSLVQQTLFGIQFNPNVPHQPDPDSYVLAARVKGKEGDKPVHAPVHAIVVADLDLMGEQFFELRRQGVENLNFDNVSFLLNAVDSLAGDDSFIALRKRRPKHRTLEAVEARTRVYEEARLTDTREAEEVAEKRLTEAQERLNQAVASLESRTDLDIQTKRIMIANQQKAENRRLAVARKNIEDEKQRAMERAKAEMESSIRGIQSTIKVLAVALPPIPAFALFLFVSIRRLRREKIGVSPDRLVEEKH